MNTLRACLTALLIAVCLNPLSASETASDAQGQRPPVFDGGVWALDVGTLKQYTDQDLQAQVKQMHDMGMRTLIIRSIAEHDPGQGQGDYLAYISNTVFPIHPAFEGRKPYSVIFRAADKHNMRVYLGGLPISQPIEQDYQANIDQWSSPRAIRYRQEIIERYANYRSFAGYYIPNTPDPSVLIANRCDPDRLLTATADVVNAVESASPGLETVMPIGLYLRPTGKGGYLYASTQDLDIFWRPWVRQLAGVDTWMVIDGIGTRQSSLDHTAMAQRWARDLAHEFGKAYWTGVQSARTFSDEQGQQHRQPFSPGELVRSLSTATRFADQTVALDYLGTLSRRSPGSSSARLHEAYINYIDTFKLAPEPSRVHGGEASVTSGHVGP